MKRRFAALPAALSLVCLTACGGGSSSKPTNSTNSAVISAPPTTPTASTSAHVGSSYSSDKTFSYVVPTGWKTNPDKKQFATFVQSENADGKVYPSFAVTKQVQNPLPTLDDLLQQGMIALRQGGSTVTSVAARTIGGEKAQGYVATRAANGAKVAQTQYYALHKGAIFIVTLTADQSKQAQAGQTLNSILDTWAWTS